MTEADEELEALRRENAQLRSRLVAAGLELAPMALPSADEVERLCQLAEAAHPCLRPLDRVAFVAVFEFIARCCGRAAEPDESHTLARWVDAFSHWASRWGRTSSCSTRELIAAAATQGVPFILSAEHGLNGAALGLASHGAGKPYDANVWRRVLTHAHMPPASSPKRKPLARPQSIIMGGQPGDVYQY